MKIRLLLSLLLISGVFSTGAAAFEQPEGEKLIIFQVDPEKWEVHNKDILESKSLVWFNKEMRKQGRTYDDFYMINIYSQSENDLNHMRDRYDKPGQKFCSNFESTDLPALANQNYLSMFWRTLCLKKRDPQARIVHLTIKGKNHIYHIQKGWRGEVEEAEVDKWVDRLKDTFLCDINREDAPCPAQSEQTADTDSDAAPASGTNKES